MSVCTHFIIIDTATIIAGFPSFSLAWRARWCLHPARRPRPKRPLDRSPAHAAATKFCVYPRIWSGKMNLNPPINAAHLIRPRSINNKKNTNWWPTYKIKLSQNSSSSCSSPCTMMSRDHAWARRRRRWWCMAFLPQRSSLLLMMNDGHLMVIRPDRTTLLAHRWTISILLKLCLLWQSNKRGIASTWPLGSLRMVEMCPWVLAVHIHIGSRPLLTVFVHVLVMSFV